MPSDESHSTLGQSVGAKIRAARLAKKYTQSQLARPDFSVSYISAIERGQIQPSLRALAILAGRLGLSSTELLPSGEKSSAYTTTTVRDKSIPDEHEVELELLETQIVIRQGLPHKALEQLRNLTSKNLNPRQELQLRYLIGWAYSKTFQLQESESILLQAQQLANDQNNPLILRILNVLGTVYASMGNYKQALATHTETLKQIESHQPQDPFFLAQVYFNMGQHYTHLSQFDEAIAMFKRALDISQQLVTPQHLKSTYLHLTQKYAGEQDYHLATLNGYKYLYAASQQSNRALLAEIYHHLGLVMLQRDPQEVSSYLETALQQESVQQNPLVLASVMTQKAAWLLSQGNIAEAEHNAQQAHQLAEDSGNTLIGAETLLVLGRIAYAQKNYQLGDTHFEAALKMLEELGASDEFSHQAFVYAGLLEERGEVVKALQYYKQAMRRSQ